MAEIILRCLQPGMVHISRQTKDHLPKDRYVVENRGLIKLKGKGEVQTFWIFEKPVDE
jgi:hypothetical protein